MANWRSLVEATAAVSSGGGKRRHTCPVCPVKIGVTDYKRSLSIDFESGWYRCFRCEFTGRLPGFDISFVESREPTEEWQDLYVFEDPSSYAPVADNPSPLLSPARRYLASRGVTRNVCREAQIGFAMAGEHAGMVIVPFLDEDGCWMGWQGRTIQGKNYHTKKDKDHCHFFNQPALFADSDEPLMIVEGTYDALPYWPNAVCCLGKPRGKQIAWLARSPRKLVVVLDSDAWEQGIALYDHLNSVGGHTGVVRLGPGQDPSTVDHKRLWEVVKKAVGHETIEV